MFNIILYCILWLSYIGFGLLLTRFPKKKGYKGLILNIFSIAIFLLINVSLLKLLNSQEFNRVNFPFIEIYLFLQGFPIIIFAILNYYIHSNTYRYIETALLPLSNANLFYFLMISGMVFSSQGTNHYEEISGVFLIGFMLYYFLTIGYIFLYTSITKSYVLAIMSFTILTIYVIFIKLSQLGFYIQGGYDISSIYLGINSLLLALFVVLLLKNFFLNNSVHRTN